jgi:hypothetical protein
VTVDEKKIDEAMSKLPAPLRALMPKGVIEGVAKGAIEQARKMKEDQELLMLAIENLDQRVTVLERKMEGLENAEA